MGGSQSRSSTGKPVVIVTGASEGGIGAELSHEFSRRGCRVFPTARKLEKMKSLVAAGMEPLVMDVTSEAQIQSVISEVVAKAGRIDILVNNAGAGCVGPMAELPLGSLRAVLETNVVGPVAVSQAVFPQMAAQRSGLIVNVGSIVGWMATPWAGAYCGSKAAIHKISDAMRLEVAPFGVKVMVVEPGAIKSHMGVNNLESISKLPPWRLFAPFSDKIAERASLSQGYGATPTSDFAQKVVEQILKKNPPPHFHYGTGSNLFWVLQSLPYFVTDRIFTKKFGLLTTKLPSSST